MLSGVAVRAWREAGEQWKAWSQRLVSVRLQTGSRKRDTLHVLSCFAPTRAARRTEKDKFYNELQQALATIPSDQSYVILGDFNAELDPEGEMMTPGVMCVVRMVTESQTMLEESYWLSWRPT